MVINPGNPTGQVLERKNQELIIKFCKQARPHAHGRITWAASLPAVLPGPRRVLGLACLLRQGAWGLGSPACVLGQFLNQ